MDLIHGAKVLLGMALRPFHAGDKKLMSHRSEVAGEAGAAADASPQSVSIRSAAFNAGEPIPRKYSAEGENVSPPLKWSGVPREAKELVLVCEDPDAPSTQPFIHWVLWGMSPQRTALPEGVQAAAEPTNPVGVKQGKNDGKAFGYTGPIPPPGHGVHHYHFQLFALDQPLRLSADPDRDELVKAMSGHVLAMGEVIGTYERK